MVIGILARLSCNVCCFLYPAYASYKALSVTPESSPEAIAQVERWLMYWAVVGTWTALEAVAGWSFTWLPFYSVFKTLVFLYLSSTQSQGASYVYRSHLAPFFHEHERDIDGFLASLRGRASTALSGGFGWILEKVKTQLNVQTNMQPGSNGQPAVGMHQPPTMQDPASGAAQQMYGYLSRYAGQYLPVALTAFNAATAGSRQTSNRQMDRDSTPTASQPNEPTPMPIPHPNVSSDPLAALRSRTFQQAQAPQSGNSPSWGSAPLPTPPAYPSSGTSSARNSYNGSDRLSAHSSQESFATGSGSSAGQSGGSGRYGEMSYEHVQRDEIRDAGIGHGTPQGQGQQRPTPDKRRSSWFGWGGNTPTQGRQKDE